VARGAGPLDGNAMAEPGAVASGRCAVAQGTRRLAPAREENPINSDFSLKKGYRILRHRIIFQMRFRSAEERFKVWKHIPILFVMNSITLSYVIDFNLVMIS
jgi:hypothetical protein